MAGMCSLERGGTSGPINPIVPKVPIVPIRTSDRRTDAYPRSSTSRTLSVSAASVNGLARK